MYDTQPDYASYSLDELREALLTIDREAYPDRTRQIEGLIEHRLRNPDGPDEHETAPRKPLSPWVGYVLGAYLLVASIAGYALFMFYMFPHALGVLKLLLIVMSLVPTAGVVAAIRLFLKDRRGYLWSLGFFVPQILSYAGETHGYSVALGLNFSINVPGMAGFRMSLSAIAFAIFCLYCFFKLSQAETDNSVSAPTDYPSDQ